MSRTSSKAIWTGGGFFALGVVSLINAEAVSVPNPFIHGAGDALNIWHYLAIGLFSFSAALFVVWYWLAERND
jgi:hypothetical protein